MNDLPESKTILEILFGAVMALLSWFARMQNRRITELERTAATKAELQQLITLSNGHLERIENTVTRTHERIDDILLRRGDEK